MVMQNSKVSAMDGINGRDNRPARAVERILQEQFVDPEHQRQRFGALALRLTLSQGSPTAFERQLTATRREAVNDNGDPAHEARPAVTARWYGALHGTAELLDETREYGRAHFRAGTLRSRTGIYAMPVSAARLAFRAMTPAR